MECLRGKPEKDVSELYKSGSREIKDGLNKWGNIPRVRRFRTAKTSVSP